MQVTWRADTSIELVGIKCSADIGRRHWPGSFIHIGRWSRSDTGFEGFNVQIPWNRELIREIEAQRQPGTGVTFRLSFETRFCRAEPFQPPGPEAGQPEFLLRAHEESQGGREVSLPISGEEWRKVLGEIGWDVTEVFELNLQKLRDHERLDAGVEHFRQAEAAHREGNWREVCLRARFACAAIAGVTDPQAEASEQEGKAIAKLVEDLFPGQGDKDRRAAFDHALHCIAALRHHAIHLGIRAQPQRHDAELALSWLAAVLRFLGEFLREEAEAG